MQAQTLIDKNGNSVHISENGDVTIKLVSMEGIRDLGKITASTFNMKGKKRSKHLFRKLQAWGINHRLLTHLVESGIQNIAFYEKEGEEIYTASAEEWLKEGTVLYFQKEGFELQCFLKDERFQKSKKVKL
jgi:hypothetical protein